MSDFHDFLSADPDSQAEIELEVMYDVAFPLALGRIECAAGLPVEIRVLEVKSEANLRSVRLRFSGRVLDLSELEMRLAVWHEQFPHLKPMFPEDPFGRNPAPQTTRSTERNGEQGQ